MQKPLNTLERLKNRDRDLRHYGRGREHFEEGLRLAEYAEFPAPRPRFTADPRKFLLALAWDAGIHRAVNIALRFL